MKTKEDTYRKAFLTIKWELAGKEDTTNEELSELMDIVLSFPKFKKLNRTKLLNLVKTELFNH